MFKSQAFSQIDASRPLGRRRIACTAVVLAMWMGPLFCEPAQAQTEPLSWTARLEQEGPTAAEELLAFQPDATAEQAAALKPMLLQAARLMGQQNQWTLAIKLLERAQALNGHLGDQDGSAFQLTTDFAIASAAIRIQDWPLAQRHAEAILKLASHDSPLYAAAYPLLIQALQRQEQWSAAAKALEQAANDPQVQKVHAALAEIAIAIGNSSLQAGDFRSGHQAYRCYSQLCPEGPLTKASQLGIAWSAAMGATQAAEAATLLMHYVDAYPEDSDAPHALHAAAVALQRNNQSAAASAARLRLLVDYPLAAPTEQTIQRVLCSQLDQGSEAHYKAALDALVRRDQDGTLTSAILKSLSDETQSSAGERLAIDLIRQLTVSGVAHEVPEAACRWASEHQKWTLLALMATELEAPSESSHRSIAIDLILAESLVQTNRAQESVAWWDWLIEHREPKDRLTLVRSAEVAVTYLDAGLAEQRVEQLLSQTQEATFERSLAVMLEAELLVRRARFDEARDKLNKLVRDEDAGRPLQPRAQWLIGETYFMQQRYAEAIDAYRRVDALDQSGQWAPLALLQAGKAFEKLGHSRDAAICYTALLSRFSDWPHASQAQSRLAAMGTAASETKLR